MTSSQTLAQDDSMKNTLASALWAVALSAQAMHYPYAPYNEGKMDPQKTGWPLTGEERKFVLLPEHERRPGREINQHKPAMSLVTPSAGFWGGTSWMDTHANLVKVAQASRQKEPDGDMHQSPHMNSSRGQTSCRSTIAGPVVHRCR
jgi:hypothetical protein